jgi:hypothetical protein
MKEFVAGGFLIIAVILFAGLVRMFVGFQRDTQESIDRNKKDVVESIVARMEGEEDIGKQ